MDFIDWLWQLLVGGGGGLLVSFGIVKFYGQSWLKSHFDKDLERAKAEFSRLSSQHIMLQNKEYEIYPELWESLNSAYKYLGAAVDPVTIAPDFSKITNQQDWLDKSDYSDDEKQYFLTTSNKSTVFHRIEKNRKLNKALVSHQQFSDCFQSNKIFLSPDVKEKFSVIKSSIESAWIAENINHQYPDRNFSSEESISKAFDAFTKEIVPLMDDVEAVIQKKLFPE